MVTRHKRHKIITGLKIGEEKIRKTARLLKIGTVGLGIGLAIVTFCFGFYTVSNWYNENAVTFRPFRLHLRVDFPVVITPRLMLPAPIEDMNGDPKNPLIEGRVPQSLVPDTIVSSIRRLESNSGAAPAGLHVYCSYKGLWNQTGYGVYQKFCFSDKETEDLTIRRWFEKRLASGMTLSQALCYYAGEGGPDRTGDCSYAARYQLISNL